jgi:hypothetical protein
VAGEIATTMMLAAGDLGPGLPIEGDVCWVYGGVVLMWRV